MLLKKKIIPGKSFEFTIHISVPHHHFGQWSSKVFAAS